MKRLLLIVALSLPLAGYCGESASETAKTQIEKEDQEARVSEAKELIREREQVMLRLNEITTRIAELDKGAKAKPRATVFLNSTITDSTGSGSVVWGGSAGTGWITSKNVIRAQ